MASLVPGRHEVRLLDQKVAPLPEVLEADLVALSFKTMYAGQAYRLADRMRAEGVRVVLGGVHASLVPEEAGAHADAVIVGEGEGVWPRVIEDAEAGRLQRLYRAPREPVALVDLPDQRVDLLDHQRYMVHATQSARGCSFDCEFCPTRVLTGPGYRLRRVEAVLAEVDRLVEIEDKPVFFTESVFGACEPLFVAELTRGLHARDVRYGVICDWHMVNQETIDCLAKHGCTTIGINLTGRNEPKEIAALEIIRKSGIPMWGYIMFGFEEDHEDVFERGLTRVREYDIRCVSATVLTPFPGTPMRERLLAESRIYSNDSDLYDHVHVHFVPKHMSVEQLQAGFEHFCNEARERMSFERALEALR
jgi:radical SAM superfamily enzyme YgiQ (UPF0313 family)